MGFYHTILRSGDRDILGKSLINDIREWCPEKGDVVIGLGNDFLWFLSDDQKAQLKSKGVKVISISSYETLTHVNSAIALTCAMAGIEVNDVAYRLDSLPVNLKAVKESIFPADWEILERIEAFLKI